MKKFQISDKYTSADIGLEIEGSSLDELFLAAAEGMVEIIFGRQITGPAETGFAVQLQADDSEQLLVDWLSELLYFFDADGLIPVKINLQVLSGDVLKLKSEIGFRVYDKARDKAEHEIKAVTYHRLKIINEGSIYRCHLVFDL